MEKFEKEEMFNGQSAAKPLNLERNGEGSTTILKRSTGLKSGKQVVYHRIRNVVYKITNLKNGKIYVGSASYYDKRIGTHISRLRRNKHDNRYLQSTFNKYGESVLSFEILEVCNQDNLLEKEQFWIDSTNCTDRKIGYNLCKFAHSKKGLPMPESAKKAIGDFFRGKKHSTERKNRTRRERTLAQGKSVFVYDKEMNFLNEYPSISETSRVLNVSISAISKQCSNSKPALKKSKNSKYVFRYKDIV